MMMTADRYTQTVLTVIAIALSAIAAHMWLAPAQAQRGTCGSEIIPCIVEVRKSVRVLGDVTVIRPVEVFGTVETTPRQR